MGLLPHPPRWADRFLEWYCNPDLLEQIQGDAYELYFRRAKENKFTADIQFVWNVVRFFRWSNIKRSRKYSYSPNLNVMFLHYLKIGLRSLLKNKSNAIINLSGLSIGLAGFILIMLYVQQELSFDKFNTNAADIYRLVVIRPTVQGPTMAKIPGPVGPALLGELPEIKKMVRFSPMSSRLIGLPAASKSDRLVEFGQQKNYEVGGLYCDASVFEIFSFKLLSGNPRTALVNPNSIVLTKSLAEKYFPSENPVGKTVTLDNQFPLEVTGVMEDVPQASHFTFSFLMSIEADTRGWKEDWNRPQYYTYLLVDHGSPIEDLVAKANIVFIRQFPPPQNNTQNPTAEFQPLTSIHLHSNLFRELGVNGSLESVFIYSSIGIFLLLIACINFMNMMTAKATDRIKEVGIRKTVGAKRQDLIKQFLSESFLLTSFSGLLALGLAYLFLPVFNKLMGVGLSLSVLGTSLFITVLIITVMIVAFISGTYPAIYLSSLNPLQLHKGEAMMSKGTLRKGLVLIQFCVSTFMILSFLIISKQADYIQHKDLGYEKDLIINIPVRDLKTLRKSETIKNIFKSHGVLETSFSANLLGGGDWGIPVQPEGIPANEVPPIRILVVDFDFVKTYGMTIVKGRDFSNNFKTDSIQGYLINEAAAKALGWTDPIGKKISMPGIGRNEGAVVGVLKDFNFRSLRETVQPIVLFSKPEWFGVASVKISSKNVPATIDFLETQWKELEPDYPFTYTFFDQALSALYAAEQRTENIVKYSSLVAILVACIGLFSLASFNVDKHSKEFGIRKVLGASVLQIVMMQLRQYSLLAITGSVFASVVAFVMMNKWFDNFAYKTTIGPMTFITGMVITILIAWLTVSVQCVRAGMTNPVQSLKSE